MRQILAPIIAPLYPDEDDSEEALFQKEQVSLSSLVCPLHSSIQSVFPNQQFLESQGSPF